MNFTEPQKLLHSALGRVPSGLFILTLQAGADESGMLASWVQQCSFDPPRVTVALKHGRWIADLLADGVPFTLNILDDTQTDMIGHFGRGFDRGQAAFEELEVDRRPDAAPILLDALGYLDCRVVSRTSAGDHDVFICDVKAGRLLDEGRPMVHVRKSGAHY